VFLKIIIERSKEVPVAFYTCFHYFREAWLNLIFEKCINGFRHSIDGKQPEGIGG